jgi:hypothetical protein
MRTSPVTVPFDLLVHVPTRSGAAMAWACTCKSATPESRSAANPATIVRVRCVRLSECIRSVTSRCGRRKCVDWRYVWWWWMGGDEFQVSMKLRSWLPPPAWLGWNGAVGQGSAVTCRSMHRRPPHRPRLLSRLFTTSVHASTASR